MLKLIYYSLLISAMILMLLFFGPANACGGYETEQIKIESGGIK